MILVKVIKSGVFVGKLYDHTMGFKIGRVGNPAASCRNDRHCPIGPWAMEKTLCVDNPVRLEIAYSCQMIVFDIDKLCLSCIVILPSSGDKCHIDTRIKVCQIVRYTLLILLLSRMTCYLHCKTAHHISFVVWWTTLYIKLRQSTEICQI